MKILIAEALPLETGAPSIAPYENKPLFSPFSPGSTLPPQAARSHWLQIRSSPYPVRPAFNPVNSPVSTPRTSVPMSSPLFPRENQLLGACQKTGVSPRNTVTIDDRTALDCNEP